MYPIMKRHPGCDSSYTTHYLKTDISGRSGGHAAPWTIKAFYSALDGMKALDRTILAKILIR